MPERRCKDDVGHMVENRVVCSMEAAIRPACCFLAARVRERTPDGAGLRRSAILDRSAPVGTEGYGGERLVDGTELAEAWLFTDIESSTRLWQSYPQAMPAAYRLHDEIIRNATDTEHGVVVSVVGDAFQAGFPSVERAVTAAIKAQRRLQTETLPLPESLRVRMAIHAATLEQKVSSLTIQHELGLVLTVAHGEQIVATGAAVSNADVPDGDWQWKELGRHLIRGIQEELSLYQVVARGLRDAFPPLRTRSMHPNNLPAISADSQREDLAEGEIRGHFGRGSRLVTLIDADTERSLRTAVACAWALLPRFPDGAFLIVVEGSLAQAVHSSLGVDASPVPTMDELAARIGRREVLLVVSGMETTDDGVIELAELLARCPLLHVMVAATEPLQSRWEHVVYLPDS